MTKPAIGTAYTDPVGRIYTVQMVSDYEYVTMVCIGARHQLGMSLKSLAYFLAEGSLRLAG